LPVWNKKEKELDGHRRGIFSQNINLPTRSKEISTENGEQFLGGGTSEGPEGNRVRTHTSEGSGGPIEESAPWAIKPKKEGTFCRH